MLISFACCGALPTMPRLARARTRAPVISMYPMNANPRRRFRRPSRNAVSASQEPAAGRRIQVRRSGVHGRGVYALRPIARGETIIEYKGQMITWKQAEARHPHDPDDPDHTFFFHIDEEHVIDAAVGGNAARWINHACNPNCESDVDEQRHRVFIKALRAIRPGEELFYDYGLVIDERYTPKVKKQFACRCGARRCRGTMLAPKR
ncbi:MAG: SET domain-containing protein-lysine N-methyltransferase [Burkholderiaceae bacterium]